VPDGRDGRRASRWAHTPIVSALPGGQVQADPGVVEALTSHGTRFRSEQVALVLRDLDLIERASWGRAMVTVNFSMAPGRAGFWRSRTGTRIRGAGSRRAHPGCARDRTAALIAPILPGISIAAGKRREVVEGCDSKGGQILGTPSHDTCEGYTRALPGLAADSDKALPALPGRLPGRPATSTRPTWPLADHTVRDSQAEAGHKSNGGDGRDRREETPARGPKRARRRLPAATKRPGRLSEWRPGQGAAREHSATACSRQSRSPCSSSI